MKKWLWLALFGCGVANADMLDALQAYEKQQFSEAKREFEQLLPLGNELAAFNLGAMAYQGEGQQADLTKAIAYFMLAAELQHDNAKDILQKLVVQANEQQLAAAKVQLETLKSSVVITQSSLEYPKQKDAPQPIKREEPKYPVEAAKKGLFGYVQLRFLVDEQGDVEVVEALDSYPAKVFEKSAIRALKRWRYQPSEQKQVLNIRFDFSLRGVLPNTSTMEKLFAESKLWQYAAAGVPNYQFVLGTTLSLMEINDGNFLRFNKDLPLLASPDFSIYKSYAKLTADFDGFVGQALVKVGADGIITEQLRATFASDSEIRNLVGMKLKGDVQTEVYSLYRSDSTKKEPVYVTPSVEASRSMSGVFWWEQAAKNGDLEAQRVLAAFQPQWETYLLAQKDAQVMAWTGTRLILEGQREQGMLLLDQAIAQNYPPAKEMKQQFM